MNSYIKMQGVLFVKEKLGFKSNLLLGSLLFGLFFGAGNLIFPVHMGQLAGNNTLPATMGFLLTGVGLPLLGVIAATLSQSESLYDLAKPVSRIYSVLFTCMLYLTIGPLFAIPRTATVAFEVGLSPFIAGEYIRIGLLVFSLVFFAVTLYFSLLSWNGPIIGEFVIDPTANVIPIQGGKDDEAHIRGIG
jgi:LIVCS family branched-chain amino acid:cation transporter